MGVTVVRIWTAIVEFQILDCSPIPSLGSYTFSNCPILNSMIPLRKLIMIMVSTLHFNEKSPSVVFKCLC